MATTRRRAPAPPEAPPERAFGRIAAPDERDNAFPLRAALPRRVALPTSRYWHLSYPPLDQGATSTCVGHGGKHWMLVGPVIQTRPQIAPTAFDLYRECTKVDEFPANDGGDLSYGTSVRALFKVLSALDLIDEYRWAQTMDDVRDFVSTQGPLVIGVNWYEGMMEPDARGYIAPTGKAVGGHCVVVIGRNNKRGESTILNSWGRWGRTGNGRALIRDPDLERLIFAEGGEAAAGLEVRRAHR